MKQPLQDCARQYSYLSDQIECYASAVDGTKKARSLSRARRAPGRRKGTTGKWWTTIPALGGSIATTNTMAAQTSCGTMVISTGPCQKPKHLIGEPVCGRVLPTVGQRWPRGKGEQRRQRNRSRRQEERLAGSSVDRYIRHILPLCAFLTMLRLAL